MVQEARQIRSAQWKLQPVRPISMDSTRESSADIHSHSPWSDTSDQLSNVTPRSPGLRASSAQIQSARPMPLGKAFEEMLANYYRTLEEIQDEEFAVSQKARLEEAEQLQREFVRREHFEMQHRKREFAIVHELHRRERRRIFDDSRAVLVTDRLADEQRKLRFELRLRQQAAKEQRAEKRAWKAKNAADFDQMCSQASLDRACNKADIAKHWQIQQAETKEKVERHKEKWARRTGQLRARRLYQQEQKRMSSRELARQHAYLSAKQRAEREEELMQKQENVHLHHVLKTVVREIQKDRKNGKRPNVTIVKVDENPQGSGAEDGPTDPEPPNMITSVKNEVCAVLGVDPDSTTASHVAGIS